MFSLPSMPESITSLFKHRAEPGIRLDTVETHDVDANQGPSGKAIKHLLKLNHATYSLLYHDMGYHNHMAHILGSAYLFQANEHHLERIYDSESKELEKWVDSPGEISKDDWRDYLGDRRYQRAFLSFFEDELVLHGYSWQKVVQKYLLEGDEPLINCVIAGLGHPLIHLGYAYELTSRELAMEALTHVSANYNYLHRYLDDPSYTKPSKDQTTSIVTILQRVANDRRFEGLFTGGISENMKVLFEDHEDLAMEYWNTWSVSNPKEQFEASQFAATCLLAATQPPGRNSYDFFIVHLLTSSHAVRIILPMLPGQFHVSLVRQWWLFALACYISVRRPSINTDLITDYDVGDRTWAWVDQQAISGSWCLDAHFVKALRAMKESAKTWGDGDLFYLKAAVKFADEFDGWTFAGLSE